jgi:capsular polysaccharide export protein
MRLDFLIPVLHHVADIEFYDLLAARLGELGASVGFVALSRNAATILERRHANVFYLYEGFDKHWRASAEEIADVERRYRLSSLADHVYPERMYYGGEVDAVVSRGVHTFRFLERLCSEHSVGAFLNNTGAEIIRRTMARIAEQGGPRDVLQEFTPFRGRITITTSFFGWDELPQKTPPASADELAHMEKLIAEYTSRPKLLGPVQGLGMSWRSVYRPLVNIARTLTTHEQIDYSNTYIYRERAAHLFRRAVNRFTYQQPRDEKFVLFPLHVPNDSAVTVRAPQFQRQQEIVRYLVERALPTGHMLYVKPHPCAVDMFPASMLVGLAAHPRIRVIDPTVTAHHLVPKATAVVAINSTVGFEGLMHFKPVVTLGYVFYRGHGVTTDVDNLADLPRLVRRAIDTPVDRERVMQFLCACFRASRPGEFGITAEDNIVKVADAIVEKARKLGVMRPAPRSAAAVTT